MKKILLSVAVLAALASFTSCKKCETCTGKVVTTLDGTVLSTTDISATEFCDEQLDVAKEGSTITQSVGGFTQTVTTTYTCGK